MSIKKSEIEKLSSSEIDKKISELERSMLELRSEGNAAKVKSVKKSIARLKTAQGKYPKTAPTQSLKAPNQSKNVSKTVKKN
ncbi:50S ribosomal protein L29 [Candidatus Micrarchaeota archaeon]|nr:50S ribosomal protein L29 [Candidatus Micrarchaeota archaeon]